MDVVISPTVPNLLDFRQTANASMARIVAISLTSSRVSGVEVDWERSWESLALRQGWEETWMLEGREDMMRLMDGRWMESWW